MKKQDKSFEDFFRESFEGAEMKPSTHVWENISNRLDGKTRNKPFYWWAGSIAASVVLIFCAYVLVYNPFADQVQGVVENHAQENQIATQSSKNNTENKTIEKTDNKTAEINNNQNITGQVITSQVITKQNSTTTNTDNKIDVVNGTNNTNSSHKRNNQGVISGNANQNIESKKANKNSNNTDLVQNSTTKQTNKSAKTTIKNNKTNIAKLNLDKNSDKIVNKDLDKNSVATIATPNDELPNNLNNDFHLLKRLSFREFPTSIKPLQVILFPLFNTTSKTDAPKVAIKIGTEIFIIGSYNSFSPNFSNVKDDVKPYPFITNDKNASMIYDSSKIAADLMNPTMISSYSIGFAINQVLYKGLGIRGGANYQAVSYELQHTKLHFTVPSSQAQVPTKPVILQQQTALLTIPISLSYQLQTGNFVYGLHAGVQTDILLQNSLTNNYYNVGDHVYNFGSYNSLNFNSLVGIRLGYMITPHFSINMEASYRKSLNSVYDTPYLQSNPQNIGAGISVGYRF